MTKNLFKQLEKAVYETGNPHRVYKVWVDIEERFFLPPIYWWGLRGYRTKEV